MPGYLTHRNIFYSTVSLVGSRREEKWGNASKKLFPTVKTVTLTTMQMIEKNGS